MNKLFIRVGDKWIKLGEGKEIIIDKVILSKRCLDYDDTCKDWTTCDAMNCFLGFVGSPSVPPGGIRLPAGYCPVIHKMN